MQSFRAFRIHEQNDTVRAGFEYLNLEELTEGEVVIRTEWSDVNYKDALAATGKGRILRKYPLVGGIDVAGTVASSSDSRFKEGAAVAVCGAGLSEVIDGGYSEYVRVPASAVVELAGNLTTFEAMQLGTAGLTAAIAVQRMQDNGQTAEKGPILVNGATGGVGSFAIDMFSSLGYQVVALTGKTDQADYLKEIGATEIVSRHDLQMGTRPLERAQWGGAVDNLGGDALSWLTRTVKPWGNIASIGLAAGVKLNTSVMPFILRGVSLLGINSVECPRAVRDNAWQRLATDLRPQHIDRIANHEIQFDQLPSVFNAYIEGKITGRTVVQIST